MLETFRTVIAFSSTETPDEVPALRNLISLKQNKTSDRNPTNSKLKINSHYSLHCVYFVLDFVGFHHSGFLVHGPAGAQQSVQSVVFWRATKCFLDDRIFQPARIPHCHETGTRAVLINFLVVSSFFLSFFLSCDFTPQNRVLSSHLK